VITKVLKSAPAGGGARQYGQDVGGLLRYLYGPGKSNEHENPHLVASWDGQPEDYEPSHFVRPDGSSRLSVGQLSGFLTEPVAGSEKIRVTDPHVYHVSLSTGPDDRRLSDEEWGEVAADMMDRVGIAPKDDPLGCRWVAVRHGLSSAGNDHVHVVATLARQDGNLPRIRGDWRALREGALEWEKHLGLTLTAAAGQGGTQQQPSIGERPKQKRLAGGDLDEKGLTTAKAVRAAAVRASNSEEFFKILEANGMRVNRSFDRASGQVRGYSIGTGSDRLSGSELQGQSLPKLQRMWSQEGLSQADKRARIYPPAAENTRELLARGVRMAAAGASGEQDFFTRLKGAGFSVKVRYSQTNPDQVTGYAVGLKGQTDATGQPIHYSGYRLGQQQIGSLRAQWAAAKAGSSTPLGAEGAARKLYVGAKLIDGSLTGSEREGAAVAAGVAVQTFAAGAEGLRGGPLTELGDQLGRASDPDTSPTFGAGSLGLMQAARGLYVLKGAATDKSHKQVLEILSSAFLLAEALHRLRANQGRAAQAQSAQRAQSMAAQLITDFGGTAPTTAPPAPPRTQPGVSVSATDFAKSLGVDHATGNHGVQPKRKGPTR